MAKKQTNDAGDSATERIQPQIVNDDTRKANHDASLVDGVEAFTYDGDRSVHDHESGAPKRRHFVQGDDDPRDASLAEHPLTEETAWTGRIFSVSRLHVEMPDGREAIRDVVRHPGAVAIVALTNDGRIVLVRQYRTALNRVTVEIPAGKLEPGEDPLECARRELLEETGLTAQNMAYLTTMASSAGFSDELIRIYMATELEFTHSDPDADEFINVDLVEVSELIDAVLDGRIEDSKTIVGALACDAMARRLAPSDDSIDALVMEDDAEVEDAADDEDAATGEAVASE